MESSELDGLDAVLADSRIPPPAEPVERVELGRVLRVALRTLGRRQREALELQHFDDQSYVEIAHHLCLTPQAAKSLLYRARLQLREALEPYELVD